MMQVDYASALMVVVVVDAASVVNADSGRLAKTWEVFVC
jgi:hypothetical protein